MHRIPRTTVLLMALLGPTAAWAIQPFSARELVNLDRISSPCAVPGADEVVFVRRQTDLTANRGRTDLWAVRTDGTGLRQITTHAANDSEPVVSPDGSTVYFLSNRVGGSQIWKIPIGGGSPERVSNLPLDVNAFVLSRDGNQIALSVDVFPGRSIEDTAAELERRAAAPQTGVLYDRLFVRHWDTWKDGRRSHLFVIPAGGGSATRDLMPNMDADVPSKPFGDASDFTFTPDGTAVVFTARDVGHEEPWSTNFDLFMAPVDGSTPPQRLTKNLAWDTGPVFSPDGKTLAYRAMGEPGYEADRFRILVREWPIGGDRPLAADWDASANGLVWSADSQHLLTTAAHRGQVPLFEIDVATGAVNGLVFRGTVSSPTIVRDKIVYGYDDLGSPVDLYYVRRDLRTARITHINQSRLANIQMGEFEQFSFDGWNNERVHGYVMKPAGFKSDRKYPIAFLIHGGPQGSFGNHWHYRWNPQTYAGRGYGVVFIDFHGSTGYGQAFTDSIRGDWGGKPLVDLQKGLEVVVERYPWLDGQRVAALGASYGGYMINWIAGHWPDRFRCLVNHDGVFNTQMMYFDTEELWFPEWENEGTPWSNPDGFRKNNPALHVDKWQTPMLVIHGARDYRVTETQGLGAFTALQRRGVPSKFLYYPDENHWVLKPHNSVQWHDTVLDWLDHWTASRPHQDPLNPQ